MPWFASLCLFASLRLLARWLGCCGLRGGVASHVDTLPNASFLFSVAEHLQRARAEDLALSRARSLVKLPISSLLDSCHGGNDGCHGSSAVVAPRAVQRSRSSGSRSVPHAVTARPAVSPPSVVSSGAETPSRRYYPSFGFWRWSWVESQGASRFHHLHVGEVAGGSWLRQVRLWCGWRASKG